jgi:two-component system response regulator RegA
LKLTDFEDKSLLILDDDDPLRGRLARAMEKKGFQVKEAKTVAEGLNIVGATPPGFACVDLRLEDGNGLDVIKELVKKKKRQQDSNVNRIRESTYSCSSS